MFIISTKKVGAGYPAPTNILQRFRHHCREVGCAAGITPFIIVPGDDFDEVALIFTKNTGEGQVNRGAVGATFEVHAHQRFVHRFEDALEAGLLGGITESLAQLFGGGLFVEFGSEIHYGDCRGRDAQGIAVELALEIGDDEGDSLGGAGGGRDDIQPGSAGAAQV